MPPSLTPEQQADSNSRLESFKNEYIELTKKYNVDFASFPRYEMVAQGVFATVIDAQPIDKKYLSVSSPMNERIIKEL